VMEGFAAVKGTGLPDTVCRAESGAFPYHTDEGGKKKREHARRSDGRLQADEQ